MHNGKRSRVPFKRGEIVSKMGSEKFCLSWTDFESNISVAFRELREEKDFFDVTLVCNEDQLQAHKVLHLPKFIQIQHLTTFRIASMRNEIL